MGVKDNHSRLADDFIGIYPLSKTLRFELIPIGRTQEYIERDEIIDSDYHRAESYRKVKKIIDQYHKAFIDEALCTLNLEGLQKYADLYQQHERDEKWEKAFREVQTSLRRQIARCFTTHPKYKNLLKKELIKKELIIFTEDKPEERALIEEFTDFTTYFTGFHSNRENMYSDEEKSTAIAYRIIHQNLPKYLDNINTYELLKKSDAYPSVINYESILREKFRIESVDDYFKIEEFHRVITQKGIDTYNYILGGFSQEGDIKVQGLNEMVNLYNQQLESTEKFLPKFKMLYKQILSDRESGSFVLEKFETDQEVLEAVKAFYNHLNKAIINNESETTVKELIEKMNDFNLKKIYISNNAALADISKYLFDDWSVLKKAIESHYDKIHMTSKTVKNTEKYEEVKLRKLRNQKVYSIKELNDVVKEYIGDSCTIEDYFIQQIEEKVFSLCEAYRKCEKLFEGGEKEKELSKNKNAIADLKNLLDAMKVLQQFIKPLLRGQEESEKDELFYVEFVRISDELDKINSLYSKVRNYITQKPYSLEKIKLNFNKSTLMDGWDRNKEKDNLGIILMKDGLYYLGIMNRRSNHIMEEAPVALTQNVYQKMEYKLLPGPNKMLPKVFFSKSRIDEFKPDKELLENYNRGTHKKGADFNLQDCHRLIDFFKRSIEKHEEWSEFDFHFSDTKTYEDISGFYREVEHQGYKVTFRNVDADYVEQLVEEGKLYLFQIYNKDFSPYSKGVPNLHTLYWKMLFSQDNLDNVVYKLNGQAEIFYRKKSIEQKDVICHKANEILSNKYPNAEKLTSVFAYDLIKDRRFTVDKFQFHVPITINFQAAGESQFNRRVREAIHDCKNMHIIGIDRGERNLLYLTVIDLQGNIKEQMSLNNIHGKDYHLLLDKREKENQSARQSWQAINTIKELKEGYLSQVIHMIAMLMIKYNAIVVLEDLNFGFMRSRQKFEKQIYQKFEKMLIDKLNYLVDKRMDINAKGGILKAYQLTDKFESFQKLGKQSGFLFYVPAWNTSKIDPTTGFVNLFQTKYESKEESRKFIKKFEKIIYNGKYFEFYFDYSDFTHKAEGSRTKWCLCTNGTRIEKLRNSDKNSEWDTRKLDLTEGLKELLKKYQITWHDSDIKQSMIEIEDADFYRSFMHFISLVLQMRNSDSKTGEDWLVSPVKNDAGEFFRTDAGNKRYPCDADANGAYNIARKGLWIVDQIQKTEIDKLDRVKLTIANKEWLFYAQEHTL